MKISKTSLDGLYLLEPEPIEDERGAFARSYCAQEFAKAGLNTDWKQENISSNRLQGTVRGLHFQRQPHPEIKLVQCIAGRIFDVAVDIRPDSATRGQWHGCELSAQTMMALYIPAGFAHGFMTLSDNAVVQYHMSDYYYPELVAGIRHDDPAINIQWPGAITSISDRDAQLPLLQELTDI